MSAAEQLDNQKPVILEITNNGIKAQFESESGSKIFKSIGLQSLARVLNKDAEFDTGFLPTYGKDYIAIKRYIKMGDKEILFIEASPANRTVNHRDDGEFPRVRFPGLLMAVTCRVKNDGTLEPRDTRLFATHGPLMRDTDRLFKFPFANVHQENGSICWGSINWRHGIRNLTQAGSLLTRFLGEECNNDLYSSAGCGVNLRDRLQSLTDASDFPYEQLREDLNFSGLMSLCKSRRIG